MKPSRQRRVDTRLLTAVSYRPASRSLSVVYDDGEVTHIAVDALKLPEGARIGAVRLDEFHRGIELELSDGTIHDVAANYITWLVDESYRRDYPDDDLGPRVGATVAALRNQAGMSQAELARAADIKGPNLSRLETGKHVPTLDVLLRIARALNVPLSRLLGPSDTHAGGASQRTMDKPSAPVPTKQVRIGSASSSSRRSRSQGAKR